MRHPNAFIIQSNFGATCVDEAYGKVWTGADWVRRSAGGVKVVSKVE
jgi:hypothetical protein